MKKIFVSFILVALLAFASQAFASSNPFADVPAGHWSYDSVAYLASRGVVNGYPDGQYKGGRLATRYEMASVVARALTKIDLEKASKEDLEQVKKLVAEFKEELDALGVKVADIDGRVAKLEKDLGGLRLNGFIWFDSRWRGSDNQPSTYPSFYFQRARFFVNYQVDKNTSFMARVNFKAMDGKKNLSVDRLQFTTKLPWDIKGTFGYQHSDWDKEYHLYDQHVGGFGDREAYWTKRKFMGFNLIKDWGKFDLQAIVGRNHCDLDDYGKADGYEGQAYMSYATKFGYKGEKLKLGLFYTCDKLDGDESKTILSGKGGVSGWSLKTGDLGTVQNYGAYLRYSLPFGEIFGTYNQQLAKSHNYKFSPKADGQDITDFGYKIDGDAKFWLVGTEIWNNYLAGFSFRAEYCRRDAGFVYNDGVYEQLSPMDDIVFNFGYLGHTLYGHDMWTLATDYHFSKKFDVYLRYSRASALNSNGPDTSDMWDFGARYKYSKSLVFTAQLGFADFGTGVPYGQPTARKLNYKGQEVIFRFRTQLVF